MRRSIEEKNSIIAALFLFQYSLLIPLMRILSPSILIAGSGIILMIAAFLVNRRIYVGAKAALVVVFIVGFMALKCLFDGSDYRVIINYLMVCIPPIIVYSYHFDVDVFLNCCYKLSNINFLLLFMIPFLVSKVAYMRFGYGMVLTVLISYLKLFHPMERTDVAIGEISKIRKNRRRAIDGIVFGVSLIESAIYGNRGVMIVILAFIAINLFLIYNRNQIKNFLLVIVGFVAALNLESILELVVQFAARFGINTYAIKKYQYQLRYGLEEASSGRGRLYRNALETIQQHPIFGDRMITYDDGTLYAHNLFLQVGRDMGVVMMIISIVFVIYCIYVMRSKKLGINEKTIIAIFFCMSVVRLMISSNIWERPEFWALLCIVFNYKNVFKKSEPNPTS